MEAKRLLPIRRAAKEMNGGPVHWKTLARWATHGISGILLDVQYVGNRRMVSLSSIELFHRRVTEAKRDPKRLTAKGKKVPDGDATQTLARFGIL